MVDYKSKVITVEEALAKIKSNDVIVTGSTAAEPKMFLENLHTIADRVENVQLQTVFQWLNVSISQILSTSKALKLQVGSTHLF